MLLTGCIGPTMPPEVNPNRQGKGIAHKAHTELRLGPGVEVQTDWYQQASQRIETMPLFSSARGQFLDRTEKNKSVEWEFLGPSSIGGRTRAMVFLDQDADRLLAGGVTGGLWLSEDGGDSWTAIANEMANIINPGQATK